MLESQWESHEEKHEVGTGKHISQTLETTWNGAANENWTAEKPFHGTESLLNQGFFLN